MEKLNFITVTLNPAVDTAYQIDMLRIGESIRTKNPFKSAGGKGLNVTRVAKLLGEEIVTTGFLGGSNGAFIREQLLELGVKDEFIHIQDETRQCLSFNDCQKNQTEILEEGPCVTQYEVEMLKKKIATLLKQATLSDESTGSKSSILTISGSLPKGVDSAIYQWILMEAKKKNMKVILDTSGQALLDCLDYGPFMIKPNLEELEQVLGYSCKAEAEIWKSMKKMQMKGIEVVIVSNGERGAFVLHNNIQYRVSTAKVEAVSAVGSGDSFVAGFAVGMVRGYTFEQTLKLASACGAANAMEERTGYIDVDNMKKLIGQISINGVQ